jgi:L-serine dehydratase
MTLSVFDLFSIGIGPSSSHTVGPMRAAAAFARSLTTERKLDQVVDLGVELHGALAATGRGHGTPGAVLLGLEGAEPERIDPEIAARRPQEIAREGALLLDGRRRIAWDNSQLIFSPRDVRPEHPNAVTFTARLARGEPVTQRWFSIGGGFIHRDGAAPAGHNGAETDIPLPFGTAAELLAHCEREDLSVAEVCWRNELARRPPDQARSDLQRIWSVMDSSIQRGLEATGVLPGGLRVPRRAAAIYARIKACADFGPASAMDRLGVTAMAVNEENAAGGRIVTAPTNGAAGVIPAVLRYALDDLVGLAERPDQVVRFLLTAAAIGSIIKQRASISGAEVGCQGEVGTACAMAAAGLAAVLDGTPAQVENAAEIGMEHHFGMTCDPIGGLVQIPCIERNSMAAVKAVHAARLALLGDGSHRVSLDQAIETMRQTGADMSDKYKETSAGGLAVNVPDC